MAKANSPAEMKHAADFARLKAELLEEKHKEIWDKPLAYWALPNDRRLPLALLDWELHELLDTPFDQLLATPGIGQKKIASLLLLLIRATTESPTMAGKSAESNGEAMEVNYYDANGCFDASAVSESVWREWRATVARHGVGHEPLGRLTPSLQPMPTVIWQTPLGNYLDVTLAEMRAMKTHGEKRVRVILEVFHVVHRLLSQTGGCDHLEVRLIPHFVHPVEDWIREAVQRSRPPAIDEIRRQVAAPLVDQIKVDAGHTVFLLAHERLGIAGEPISVRAQSRRMGVTRARIYQLLDDCGKIMEVRWPEGRLLFAELQRCLEKHLVPEPTLVAFDTIRDLFYPATHANLEAPSFT